MNIYGSERAISSSTAINYTLSLCSQFNHMVINSFTVQLSAKEKTWLEGMDMIPYRRQVGKYQYLKKI